VVLRTSIDDECEAHRLYDAFLEQLPQTRAWLAAVTADDPLVHLDGTLDSLDALAVWFERSLDAGTLPVPEAPAIYGTGHFDRELVRRIRHDVVVTSGFERMPFTTDLRVLQLAEAFAEALGGYLAEVCRGIEPRLTWAPNLRPGIWGFGMPVLMGPSAAPLPPTDPVLRPVKPLNVASVYVAPVLDGVRRPIRLRASTCFELRQYGVDDAFPVETRTGPIRPYRLPWWARHDQNLESMVRTYHPSELDLEEWENDLVAVEHTDERRWSHEVTVNDEMAHDDDLMAAFRKHLRRLRRVRRVAHVDREVFLVHAPRLSTAKLGVAAAEWLRHHTDHGQP